MAVVLAGGAAAVALNYADGEGRTVGTWQPGTPAAQTPVAAIQQQDRIGQKADLKPQQADHSAPGAVPTSTSAPAPAKTATSHPVESATAAGDGRQKVGQLVDVGKLLGYLAKSPQREEFSYPGASYVKLHFDRMAMLPGDYLTVSNPDGTESYRYDAPSLLDTGKLDTGKTDKWAMSITGDKAVLEMHRAAGDALGISGLVGNLGVDVDQAARGFSRTEQAKQPADQLEGPGQDARTESVCGTDTSTDAVCYRSADPVAYTHSKAIARLLINGTELCTGWRVGPNNRMLTNNHCFTTSDEAYDTEVWFNYQCSTCGGFDVYQPTKVWGDKVLSTDHTYDYTLFTVSNFAAVHKFGYLTLDTVRPAKNQELYIPQHPAGEPTRIAGSLGEKAGNCSVADPAYDGYAKQSDVAYYCDTEGGSSGSPVISRATNKVVALHHFGGCPNSGVRADLLAARLAKLL